MPNDAAAPRGPRPRAGSAPGLTSRGRALTLGATVVATIASAPIARADFHFKKGSFAKTGTAAPASQSVTGVGFQPKAVIFTWTRQTIEGLSPQGREMVGGFGMATGPANERAIYTVCADESAGSDCNGEGVTTAVIRMPDSGAPVVVASAELTSLDADGFTLNWTLNESEAHVIHYVALGGSDITNAVVSHFDLTTGVGSQAVTGLGFEPDFLMFLSHDGTLDGGFSGRGYVSLGFASSATDEAFVATRSSDGVGCTFNTASDSGSWQRPDRVFGFMPDGDSVRDRVNLTSLDPDGFTLSKEVRGGASPVSINYLALEGLRAKVGSFNGATALGSQGVSGVGFTPAGLVLASVNRPADAVPPNIPRAQGRMSFGASDGLDEGVIAYHDEDDRGTTFCEAGRETQANTYTATTKVAAHIRSTEYTENPTQAVVEAAADLQSFDADGFTLSWTTNILAQGDEIVYVAFGPAPATMTLYRSVGVNGADLNTSARTVEIVGSTATFSGPMPDSVGIGDALTYDAGGARLAFIHGRASSTQYTVKDKNGNPPTAAAASTPAQVRRSYASLADWESQVENPGIAEPVENDVNPSPNLVASNTVMLVACYGDGPDTTPVTVSGWTTGPDNPVVIFTPVASSQVGVSQRHAGTWSTSKYRLEAATEVLRISDNYAHVEGLQVRLTADTASAGAIVFTRAVDSGASAYRVSNNIVRGNGSGIQDLRAGISLYTAGSGVVRAWNNVVYDFLGAPTWASGIRLDDPDYTVYLYNNTVADCDEGIAAFQGSVVAKNNLAYGNVDNYWWGAFAAASSNNLSGPAQTDAPGSNPRNAVTVTFANAAGDDFHLGGTDAGARDFGLDLSADPLHPFLRDVDTQRRVSPWDIGADDQASVTAVKLVGFAARGFDGAVELVWETGSELDNLGFHLYRARSEEGPFERITATLLPGLGSSPAGARYAYWDAGVVNGARHHYALEDVESTGRTERHGPVSATPHAGAGVGSGPGQPGDPGGSGGTDPADGAGGDGTAERGGGSAGERSSEGLGEGCPPWLLSSLVGLSTPVRCAPHGDPDAVSLSLVGRSSGSVELELETGGFWSVAPRDAVGAGSPGEAGARLYARGFDTPLEASSLALPLRRALVDAVVGKQVRLVSVESLAERRFPGLRPSVVGEPELAVSGNGTVHATRRSRAASSSGGLSPAALGRLAGTVFQEERKKAVVELMPVRYDGSTGEVVLSSRVRARLVFAGVAPGETGTGSTGRRKARGETAPDVLARLYAAQRGLHGVRFQEALPGRVRGLPVSVLRLQRDGQAVSFRVEPRAEVFGPGSTLYFHVERAARSLDFSGEVAYELVKGAGELMEAVVAAPEGPAVAAAPLGFVSQEVDRIYQSGLVEAQDVWLWEAVSSGQVRKKGFSAEGLDAASPMEGRLAVHVQGASASGTGVDHHVRVALNGLWVGEASFSGKRPFRLEAVVPAGAWREGENEIAVANVGDTGVQSLFFLDRFEVMPPRKPQACEGAFRGRWPESGTVEVPGFSSPPAILELPPPGATHPGSSSPSWVVGSSLEGSAVRWQAKAGFDYVVASRESVLRPRVERPAPSTLRSASNRADYLLIAPEGFLAAAEPLLVHRASQGLAVKAVSLEEVGREFGHGTASGEAIRSFVSHAYHGWAKPSPRYLVLLGDATYDPRFLAASTAQPSPLPALWGKTTWLWTATDPVLGAVNGEDEVPDLAVGRIPATTVEQAEALVGKLLAWEGSGQGLEGKALLVADNPDVAGDFEWDVEDIRASFLGDRETEVLKVGELGADTREAVRAGLDGGLGLLSYVGHGGSAVWASESVWNSWDAASLRAQSRQPLLLTLNCLNGYFVGTNFESLAESLVKAEGRGAIAAFSPSGLSVDGPAHQYHRALVGELVSGRHGRLGDAVLAAQQAYAQTGLMPELLSVYQLLGDPAMAIR
jgi:hypothetical protein